MVTDSFGLGEVNAEEKPELFYSLPGSVEMGRVNGTLLILGFLRLGFETDPSWSYLSLIHYGWIWYPTPLSADSLPHSSVSYLLWLHL